MDMVTQLMLILQFLFLQERVVAPHLKHDYNAVCNIKPGQQEQKPATSKLFQLFRWLLSKGNDDTRNEL